MASFCAWHSRETLGPCPCVLSRGCKMFFNGLNYFSCLLGCRFFVSLTLFMVFWSWGTLRNLSW